MRRFATLTGMVLAAVFLFGVGTVQAQNKTSLLLLNVDGDLVSDADKATAVTAFKKQLHKYNKYRIVEAPQLDLLEAMVDHECLDMDAECLAAIGKGYKVQQVLYTGAEGGGMKMVLVDVPAGKELARYEQKGDAKAAAVAMTGAGRTKLFGKLPKPKPVEVKRVTFTIDSNVKDSVIYINDKKIGPAPMTMKLKPGRYTFRIERDGFLTIEEKIQVAEVGNKSWKANLKPIPTKMPIIAVQPDTKKDDDDKGGGAAFYKTWWFWTSVGVGVAAITTTALVLGLQGEDSYPVGTAKFSIDPSLAQYDGIFYKTGDIQ